MSACLKRYAAHSRPPLRKALAIAFTVTAATASAQTPNDLRLYARLMAMTDSRSYDRALIDSVLASTWRPLRAAGTLAIGQVGPAHGKPGLLTLDSLVSDKDPQVASNAAYALGLLRDSTSVYTLSGALPGPVRTAREAAWALGEIGAPARTAILGGLAKPPNDDALAIQLLFAASSWFQNPCRKTNIIFARPSQLFWWEQPSVPNRPSRRQRQMSL